MYGISFHYLLLISFVTDAQTIVNKITTNDHCRLLYTETVCTYTPESGVLNSKAATIHQNYLCTFVCVSANRSYACAVMAL